MTYSQSGVLLAIATTTGNGLESFWLQSTGRKICSIEPNCEANYHSTAMSASSVVKSGNLMSIARAGLLWKQDEADTGKTVMLQQKGALQLICYSLIFDSLWDHQLSKKVKFPLPNLGPLVKFFRNACREDLLGFAALLKNSLSFRCQHLGFPDPKLQDSFETHPRKWIFPSL